MLTLFFPGGWPRASEPTVAMTKEEERELREQLARLQQEHRDLDAAIAALAMSPGSDLIQVQRLKTVRSSGAQERAAFVRFAQRAAGRDAPRSAPAHNRLD